jgi:hypothetical protein
MEEERIKKVLANILQERQVTHLSAGSMVLFCNVCGNRTDCLVDGVCNYCNEGKHKLYTTKEVIELVRRLEINSKGASHSLNKGYEVNQE